MSDTKRSAYLYDRDVFRPGPLFYRPNTTALFARVTDGRVEYCHRITWNNWGFRDQRSYAPRRTASQLRIAVIGDSFTSNLDSEVAWPSLLEDRLRIAWGEDVQVYNLGLPGAGPANWIALAPIVRRLAPDAVVVACYDGIVARPRIEFFAEPQRGRFSCRYGYPMYITRPIGLCRERFLDEDAQQLAQEIEALAWAQKRVRPTWWSHARAWARGRTHNGASLLDRHVRLIDRMLGWAQSACIARCPSQAAAAQEHREDDEQSRALATLAKRRSVPLVDLWEPLSAHGVDQLYAGSSGHWSASGNRIVADAMSRQLVMQWPRLRRIGELAKSRASGRDADHGAFIGSLTA